MPNPAIHVVTNGRRDSQAGPSVGIETGQNGLHVPGRLVCAYVSSGSEKRDDFQMGDTSANPTATAPSKPGSPKTITLRVFIIGNYRCQLVP